MEVNKVYMFFNKITFKTVFKRKEEHRVYEIICPYCFRRFLPSEVVFRAMHSVSSDENYRLQPDELLNRYRSKLKLKPIREIEAVIHPEQVYKENRKCIKGVLLELIDNYGVNTRKRLCPHCHNELPSSLGKGPCHIISIIGSPKVGKSTYMTVLLHSLQEYAAKDIGAVCYFSNSRYRHILRECEDTLYNHGNTIQSDVGEENLDHLVLIFQFNNSEIPITFIFYDVSSLSMLDKKHMDIYEENIKNSSGIIFLVDPMQLGKLRERNPINSKYGKYYRPRDVIAHLHENFIFHQEKGKSSIPTAVVLTKVDILKDKYLEGNNRVFHNNRHINSFNVEEFLLVEKEISSFIQNNDSLFFDTMKQYFRNYAFLGISSISNLERQDLQKIKVDPKRVEEPLLWIMYKLGYIKGGSSIEPDSTASVHQNK